MAAPDIYSLLCPSYHGATLLSLVLGNHSRILAMGDTIPKDMRGRCGCGLRRRECPFWIRLYAESGPDRGGAIIPAIPRIVPWRALNQILAVSCGIAAART